MDRYVVVSAKALGDLLDLVDRALPDLDEVISDALAGAAAEVRVHSLLEPA